MPEDLQLAEAYVDITLRDEELNAALADLRSRMAAAPLEVPVAPAADAWPAMRDKLRADIPDKPEGGNYWGGYDEGAQRAAVSSRALTMLLRQVNPELAGVGRMAGFASRQLSGLAGSSSGALSTLGTIAGKAPGIAAIGVAGGLAVAKLVDLVYWYGMVSSADRNRAENAKSIAAAEEAAQQRSIRRMEQTIELLKRRKDWQSQIADLERATADIGKSSARLEFEAEERRIAAFKEETSGSSKEKREREEAALAMYEANRQRLYARNAIEKKEADKRAAEEERQRQERVYAAMQESKRRMDEEDKEAKRRDRALELLDQEERDKAQDRRLAKDARARSEAAEALRVGLVGGAQEMWAQIQGGPAEQAAKAAEEANRIARESVDLERQIRDNTAKRKEILGE